MNAIVAGASQRFSIPSHRLWPRMLSQYFFGQFSVNELRAYATFVPSVLKTFPVLISKQSSLAKLERINTQPWQTEDKEQFYMICEKNNIPHPRVLAIIGNGCIRWRTELPAQFISKEKSGAHASGFAIFERVGSDLIKVNDGIEQPLQGVLAKLSTGNSTFVLVYQVGHRQQYFG
jgi:uncharacterized protein (UPF0248 family)